MAFPHAFHLNRILHSFHNLHRTVIHNRHGFKKASKEVICRGWHEDLESRLYNCLTKIKVLRRCAYPVLILVCRFLFIIPFRHVSISFSIRMKNNLLFFEIFLHLNKPAIQYISSRKRSNPMNKLTIYFTVSSALSMNRCTSSCVTKRYEYTKGLCLISNPRIFSSPRQKKLQY